MKRDLFVITSVSLLLIIIWFHDGSLFATGEESLSFYDYFKTAKLSSYAWFDIGIGQPQSIGLSKYPYFYLLSFLQRAGVPNFILQAITFYTLMLIGMISVYFLLKITILDRQLFTQQTNVPLLGALFYFFNPYSMSQVWGRSLSNQMFAFALIPSFLLCFVLGLKFKDLRWGALGIFFSLVLATAYIHPAIIITSWSTVFVYLFFSIIKNLKYKQILFSLFFFLLFCISWGLAHAYWIYPLLGSYSSTLSANLESFDSIKSMIIVSKNNAYFDSVIRLLHPRFFDGSYGTYYQSKFLLLLGWILPFVLLVSISLLKRSSHFIFFSILFLVSLFVTMGGNPPLGFFIIWLFEKFPILQSLRNPYEKYGFNLILSYSAFFAVGVSYINQAAGSFLKKYRLGYYFLPTLLILLFIVYLWPFWNRTFADYKEFVSWVKVPQFYRDANSWLNKQPGNFRLLHLPLLPGEGIRLAWNRPYAGVEPSEFLFSKPSIGRNMFQNSSHYLYLTSIFNPNTVSKAPQSWFKNISDFEDKNLNQELTELNIRYIVLHHDLHPQNENMASVSDTQNFLNSQEYFKKVQTFGQLDIYEVEHDQKTGLIYSPDEDIVYKEINPVYYTISLSNSVSGLINLHFLKQYNPSWELVQNGKNNESHFELFGYANGWKVDPKMGNNIIIRYKPQMAVEKGIVISKISGGLLVIFLLTFLSRNLFKYKRLVR